MYAYTRHCCYANVRLCLQTLSYVTRASSPSTTLSICISHILQPPSVDNERDVKLSYPLSLPLSLDVEYDIIANSNDVVAGGDARSLTIFSPEGFKRVAAGAARIDRRINRPIDTKALRPMQRESAPIPSFSKANKTNAGYL